MQQGIVCYSDVCNGGTGFLKQMDMITEINKDLLQIKVFANREQMGKAAADDAQQYIQDILSRKDEINVVFAAAPSQCDLLASLVERDIPWERINAFHMDEYVGLDRNAPQSFGRFLDDHIFSLVPFKSVHYIARDEGSAEDLCEAYRRLLEGIHLDIVFMGIGENGHIAFNDPPYADFDDPLTVKILQLDEVSRIQQVHDGCFPSVQAVPTHAITLTIPTLMSADRLFNVVPTAYKAEAVRHLYHDAISPACPASICRKHGNATLYLDRDSARYIL